MDGNRNRIVLSVLALLCCMTMVCQSILAEWNETVGQLEIRITNSFVEDKLNFHHQLSARWAPVHFQDVDVTGSDSLGGLSDYITAIDFDGDWNTRNNWENLSTSYSEKNAFCYYSVVETETHWFIVYAFYHPRDWSDNPIFGAADTHENDMEGLLAIVKKPAQSDSEKFGELLGIVTVFHRDFFSFTPVGSSIQPGQEDIDGTLRLESFEGKLHPVTAQEAKGHGLQAVPYVDIKGGDGIKYFPSATQSEEPCGSNDREVKYQLVNIFKANGLWDHRNDPQTFAKWGVFSGDNGVDNSAHAPWKWDDHDDAFDLSDGELATDPAKLVEIYFTNLGTFSRKYVFNKYIGVEW